MYSEIAKNKRKTVFILLLFILLVTALSWVASQFFGNSSITVYVLIGSLVYAAISYYSSSKIALAMNGAKEIKKRDNPRLYRIVENLAITEGMPTPKIHVVEDRALNAFATGRNPKVASVAATTGLLDALDDQELEGVMAHELGHIKNYDIRVSMIAFALVAAIGLLADFILHFVWFGGDDDNKSPVFLIIGIFAALLAPLVATLIQLAISRKREYLADATGVLTTRYPEGLSRALAKIGKGSSTVRRQNTSTAHLFFASPLKGKSLASLFSTHPPIAERIARLEKMKTNL